MSGGFTAEERRRIARALHGGEPLLCPACGEALTRRDVEPSRQVAYVRRRVWVLCPACGRTGALDIRAGGRP